MYIPNLDPEFDVSKETIRQIRLNDALNSARNIYIAQCKDTDCRDRHKDNWQLKDYVESGEQYANEFKQIAEDKYGYYIRDLQTISYKDVGFEVFQTILSWRMWQRYVNRYKSYLKGGN